MSANSKIPVGTKSSMERVRKVGAALLQRGAPIGHYFQALKMGDIATQRTTKDQLPARLRAAAAAPQIISVQGRGENEGGVYLIMPLEKVEEVIEAKMEERRSAEASFVPITVALREIGGDIELPIIVPRGSGRRRRSASSHLKASLPTLAAS